MNVQPLAGKRILITRAQEQGSRLQMKLEAEGAEVVAIPAIEIVPPASYAPLDAALEGIASFEWLVLTSANAVRAIAERAKRLALPLEMLSAVYIAVIGKATADAVTALGLAIEVIPPQAVAESLAEALKPRVMGKRVLLVRAKVARDVLPSALVASGADLTIVDAYQTVIPAPSVEALRIAFRDGVQKIDAVVFTSASTVHNFLALAQAGGIEVPSATKKVSIGPITTGALLEDGLQADAEAGNANIDELVAAVVRCFV